MPDTPAPLDAASREAILNKAVADAARKGWTVGSVTAGQAVLQRNKKIGWFWNIVLSIITGGLWLIVVLVRVVNRKKKTLVLSVDPFGRVTRA